MNTEQDAHDQLSAARAQALAWLRATLAALPAAVTSLSVGAVLDEGGDRATLVPRLRAEVVTPGATLHYPDDYPDEGELECIDALDDGLGEMTRPFLFAIHDEEWLTVTRADLDAAMKAAGIDPFVHMGRDTTPRRWISSKNGIDYEDPPPATEAEVLAAIMQEIADLPRGDVTSLRIRRDADGALKWAVTEPVLLDSVDWPTAPGWWWLARPDAERPVIVEASTSAFMADELVVWFGGNEVEFSQHKRKDGWRFAPVRETPPVLP